MTNKTKKVQAQTQAQTRENKIPKRIESPCDQCGGGELRCYCPSSPCYLHFCGMYPGTGPRY